MLTFSRSPLSKSVSFMFASLNDFCYLGILAKGIDYPGMCLCLFLFSFSLLLLFFLFKVT